MFTRHKPPKSPPLQVLEVLGFGLIGLDKQVCEVDFYTAFVPFSKNNHLMSY